MAVDAGRGQWGKEGKRGIRELVGKGGSTLFLPGTLCLGASSLL